MLAESGETLPCELAKHNRARIVCVSVWLSFVYFAFYISIRLHVESLYLFMCGGMMIKCVCLWFCGINGLFTKTVNKRE